MAKDGLDMAKKNVERDEMLAKLAEISRRKHLPILVLDERWHVLFPEEKKTSTIKKLEKKLNELLKHQGKLITEAKEMKKLKSSFMAGIVNNMQEVKQGKEEELRRKKLESSQKYIKEINEKLAAYDDELERMPRLISEANEQLLIESVRICYADLHKNKEKIGLMQAWIMKIRDKLKETLIEKQELEETNTRIYTYMHGILGREVIEIFDADHTDL